MSLKKIQISVSVGGRDLFIKFEMQNRSFTVEQILQIKKI